MQGKTGKMVRKEIPVREYTGNFAKTQVKHREFPIFFGSWICLPSQFEYVIVTNHVNWHRENVQSDGKTGETQGIKFNLSGNPV